MTETDKTPSQPYIPHKRSVALETVRGIVTGIGALVTAYALAEGAHASFRAGEFTMPKAERIKYHLIDSPGAPINGLIVASAGLSHLFGTLIRNKKIDQSASVQR